jgi:glycosyltransferase involved in cell wall biosynthesis
MNICRIATVPFMLHNHLNGQITATIEAGHQVTLISSNGEEVEDLLKIPNIRYELIEIPRKISPLKDLIALYKLITLFKTKSFDIVHSVSPKAGLLCAIAGLIARVPVRLHTFTGQPWVEMQGWIRHVAMTCDKLIGRLNTHCYADSQSQAQFLIDSKIIEANKISVIGQGSVAGVDLGRFNPECYQSQRLTFLTELGLDQHSNIITFIGRITRDKGIFELLRAFKQVQVKCPNLVLLLVGPLDDELKQWPEDIVEILQNEPTIHQVGYARQPEKFLSISDLLCLPSYREGFGGVVIEAAAMKVATIGTRIVGLTDAIIHNQTGLLVDVKSELSLQNAIERMFNEAGLRESLAINAYLRAVKDFDSHAFNQLVIKDYVKFHTIYHQASV